MDSCCSHTSRATPFDRERRGHSSADAGCLLVLSGSTLTLHYTQYTRRTSTLLSERTMLLFAVL